MEVRLGEGPLPNKSSKNSKISDCINDVCSVPQCHHCVFLVRSITVTTSAFITHFKVAEFWQPEHEMPWRGFRVSGINIPTSQGTPELGWDYTPGR